MKKTQKPFIVKLAILTVLTSIIWTGFDVYRRLTTKPAPSVPQEVLNPIIPELNQETLARLEKTVYLEDDELGDTLILSTQGTVIEPAPETPPEEVAEETEIITNE